MSRIDEIWLATEPLDMRAGPDKALARGLALPDLIVHTCLLTAGATG